MRHRLTQTFAVILSNERTNLLPHPNASMTAEGRAVNGEKLNGFFISAKVSLTHPKES